MGVWYTTREDVKSALDMKETARNNVQVDRCIEAASRAIDGEQQIGGLLKRRFYPLIATRYWDFPSFQYAYPWRVWFDQWELAAIPTSVTSGGVPIPLSACNFEPANSGPPYTYLELRRDQSYSFGAGSTPQRNIAITGAWGYWTATTPAGALAAAITDTTGTAVQVTDSSLVGVGDAIKADSEFMLVTGRTWVSTGQTQQGSGCSTASAADVTLGVTDGTKYAIGETLLLDSERMLVVDIAGNNATVKRAWDGSVLAVHTGATIYAPRQLTVTRGDLGTTAATHANAAVVVKNRVPGPVKELCLAYACSYLTSESSGWARQWGEGQGSAANLGRSIAQLENDAVTAYGRKARVRVI